MTAWTLLIIAALTAIGFFVGRARAQGLRNAGTTSLHSLPTYHGLLMASMTLAAASITTLAVALVAGSDSLIVPAAAALLGTGAIAKNETVALSEEEDRYRLDVFGPSSNGAQLMRRRLWFERQTLHVVQEDRLTESGAVEATIQYEDFRPIGEVETVSSAGDKQLVRPFKILLEDGKGQGSVQVTFHEMIPNIPLSAADLGQT